MRFFPALLPAVAALSCVLGATAQTSAFTDPANLRGERVQPRTGRELPVDRDSLGLEQLLRRLNTRASLMNIVAHPDDEDGGMLTFYSRGLGARVADLSLTRGEGGQNAMTGDFEDALGLLRTQELLSSDRYAGVDQFFGTEVDFGFSKTKEEAFSKWTHERVLYDAVRAVRLYRPLVLVSTFIGGVTDGHGQHQVSGEIAQEVFKAAGDPNVFPELTREGILPWQPLKVYARVPMGAITDRGLFDYATGQYAPARFVNYVTGEVTTAAPAADVVVHEGTPDPLLSTCAANPNDLTPLTSSPSRAAGSAHTPTDADRSGAPPAHSAPEPRPSSTCKPLSYVQFARIGLGLQKSQIGPGVRNAPSGAFDVAYHLYGSRLCSAPSTNTRHPERSAAQSKDPCISPAAALPSTSDHEPPSADRSTQAPTARSIPAQGNTQTREGRAEGPTNTPATSPQQATFFDGIDTSVAAIGDLAASLPENTRSSIAKLGLQFENASRLSVANPSAIAPLLADTLATCNTLIGQIESSSIPPEQRENVLHELRIKQAQLNEAIALTLGLTVDSTATTADLNTGAVAKLSARIQTTSPASLTVDDVHVETAHGGQSKLAEGDVHTGRPLTSDHADERTLTLPANETLTETRPYFFRDNIEQPVYQLHTTTLRNAPATPAPLVVWARIDYRGVPVTVGRVVHADSQPIRFTPPLSLTLSSHAQVLPLTERAATLTAQVECTGEVTPAGKLNVNAAPGWTVNPAVSPLRLGSTTLKVTAPASAPQPVHVSASVLIANGGHIHEGFRPVGYGDLPRTNFYTPATTRIVPVDLKLPIHRRIAYLPGTGDDVPAALGSVGLAPTILTVADLTPSRLASFDTVILGVRTYNAHPDLHGAATQALLDFARAGGNVLVQYQTYEFTAADAPYPLTLGNAEKVVDETDAVNLSNPSAALFTAPNRIRAADFDNWIEERGHGFLGTWDAHYTALTETHDPGQEPQRGGLVTAQLGRGHWTYCAFALYRQLPEAVPGAYRIFANLLGLADTP